MHNNKPIVIPKVKLSDEFIGELVRPFSRRIEMNKEKQISIFCT